MRVKVKFLATLYDLLGVMRDEAVVPEGATVFDLIKALDERYGGRLSKEILDGDRLKDEYNVLVNGRAVDFLEGLSTRLRDGDEVVFLPPVAGG
ncbi:MAG: ubiquitin-like small modifier protein 1 [Thermoproteus sp. AZ2]|uniref:Ubiquitin-like small modifier protein 1 n=1 Tax=Thermoproteus sp. AZ2 TaxID=1609232 RepID=A0ACC6UY86_9CREN